jgi:ADP-ribose pyrophosphatase
VNTVVSSQAVAVVAVDRGDLVMVRELRGADGDGALQVPIGMVRDEQPLDAARRELLAGTGNEAGCWRRVTALRPCPGRLDRTTHVFLATLLSFAGDGPGPRSARVVRVPVNDFAACVAAGELRDAHSIAAVYVAAVRPGVCDCGPPQFIDRHR